MRTLLATTLLAFTLAFSITAARADERILDFTSNIEVHKDDTVLVAETITVVAENARIRHGINRDIPTIYRSPTGEVFRVGLKVVSVTRDGHPEPYTVLSISNGKRLRIGSASKLVSPGEHTYTITYEVTNELGFFKDYDELYWNVTGNGSIFPIQEASAIVELPAGARILDYTGYTGPQGARGKDFRAQRLADNRIRFDTTRSLGPKEGLTIVVTWPKGIVAEPTQADQAARFLRENLPILVAGVGFAILFVYYFLVWIRVGRDPPPGTIVPRFHPPQDLSPSAVRFIRRMGYDRKAFTAALIDMAVKGVLKIEDDGHSFTLRRIANAPDAKLTRGERRIAAALFAGGAGEIEMDNSNHSKFGSAINRLREALQSEYERKAFVSNQGYFWLGMALTLAMTVMAALVSPSPGEVFGVGLFVAVWAGAGSLFMVQAWRRVTSATSSFGDRVGGVIQAAFALVFAVPLVIGLLIGGRQLAELVSIWTPALLAGAAALNVVFFHLLKAPTAAGRKLMDAIEGLHMYMATAEQHRLDVLNPPKETPELFEQLLPYALALDVENQWNKRFADVLARAAQEPGATTTAYSPVWYSGPRMNSFATGAFAGALGGALASAAAAAATPPGSSSGMGGGGFSGGGGGGGGVGGW